jgi:hypothetical protein
VLINNNAAITFVTAITFITPNARIRMLMSPPFYPILSVDLEKILCERSYE